MFPFLSAPALLVGEKNDVDNPNDAVGLVIRARQLTMTPSGQRLKNLTTYGRADVDPINCEDQYAQADGFTLSRLAVFVDCGGLPLGFGFDCNFNVSTLFEFHIIAMFVC
jgi:hypothetical protein